METFREVLDNSNSIGIIAHINPDADNLGSITALAESMRLYGKKVTPICIDEVPYNLEFLHGIDKLTDNYQLDFDLLFILDSSSIDRLGKAKDVLERSKYVVNIDHHFSNNMKGDFDFIDRQSSSTGEVLYELLVREGLPIDKNIAESIYTAISGDTGSFRYDSTSKRTFEIVGELLDYKIDTNKINNNLYGNNRFSKAKMLALAIERVKIINDVAITYILKSDYQDLDALGPDVEGIVEYIRDIEGVEVSIFLKESEDGFKASTRSKNNYNVADLSAKFGGGGHKKAAGFFIESKNLDKIIDEVIKSI